MSRGGTRPGSGKKPMAAEDKRVQVTLYLRPDTVKRLREMSEATGTTLGRVVESLIAK